MDNTRKSRITMILAALVIAGGLTVFAALGLLETTDLALSDAWYQKGWSSEEEIVLVGIDQRALEDIGPYHQWGRDIIAMVLDALNESEECHPAVIGLDVLYIGETSPEADEWLAQAAGKYGNVVAACCAEFGDVLTSDGNEDYYLDTSAILSFDEPYPALHQVSTLGHVNTMLDNDGIMRHHLLSLKLPDGREVPSLALAMAQNYRQVSGQEKQNLPQTDSRGFWYVPFSGPPGHFDESISVVDLLSGEKPAEYFSGKIVLIGPYASGLQDSYLTAVDHAKPMYGVEYHANALQALLREDFKKEVPDRIQLMVLFVVLLVSILCFWKRPVWFSTAIWLFFGGFYLFLCRFLYHRGMILHVLWLPAGVTVLYIGMIAFNYIQEALKRLYVTRTFKRYVAPEIVNEIFKQGSAALELGGKLTSIAVLFVDVRGFTPLSESLQPPQVVEILNDYLDLISECILNHQGTLDKFVGDAAMAFWGAPLPQDDYVMKAVQAAWDMVRGSQKLSMELMERYGQTVAFGVGVHVGEAVVGNIGSSRRMDYTAIGDTVNTAARLEANAPGGTIYISRAVADALEGRIKTTSLGSTIKLKGKKEGFEILTVDEIC